MQSALHDLAIPSVEQAMKSVFESDEARELQCILAAILPPGREAAVKSALTTDALGINGSQLQALVANEHDWQARLQTFAGYRTLWERDGFFSMFSHMLRQEQVIENLLRFTDAERRITKLRRWPGCCVPRRGNRKTLPKPCRPRSFHPVAGKPVGARSRRLRRIRRVANLETRWPTSR